jgi:hypothetical protein
MKLENETTFFRSRTAACSIAKGEPFSSLTMDAVNW